jgi:hypothetical protein
MKLGQFDQREQAGGMGSQGQIRIAQIQQLRALVLQVGQINPAVSGLGETLVGIARKAQIARWARMALDLVQDPGGLAAAGRTGNQQGLAHAGATQASSWALRAAWSRSLPIATTLEWRSEPSGQSESSIVKRLPQR